MKFRVLDGVSCSVTTIGLKLCYVIFRPIEAAEQLTPSSTRNFNYFSEGSIAYIKVVAVKKLVVGSRQPGGSSLQSVTGVHLERNSGFCLSANLLEILLAFNAILPQVHKRTYQELHTSSGQLLFPSVLT